VIKYIVKRLLFFLPMVWGLSTVVFFLVRLLGNPAALIAGSLANAQTLATINARLGRDQPLGIQYIHFLQGLLHGNLGTSWVTGNPVLVDLTQRFPATFELISAGLLLTVIIGVPVGLLVALRPGRWYDRVIFIYGLFAGALPDFWVGLLLIFFFYVRAHLFPGPIGQLDLNIVPSHTITGMVVIDSLLTTNWPALRSSILHLVLPVITLVFVYTGPVIKMTRSIMEETLHSDYMDYAKVCGFSRRKMTMYALRNALPPVTTVVGFIYVYLFGGAVLVETVFAWGGIGQYSVQAITNIDFEALQGFVIVTAIISLAFYLVLDIIYTLLDPRIHYDEK
jgi:ABC-type dipeptide/oligopeptide/nickel transport system permease component